MKLRRKRLRKRRLDLRLNVENDSRKKRSAKRRRPGRNVSERTRLGRNVRLVKRRPRIRNDESGKKRNVSPRRNWKRIVLRKRPRRRLNERGWPN